MTTAVSPPGRILIVAMDNLGDLVFTSTLAPPLRTAFPNAVIDVWCKAYTADVARLIPHVDRVIAADPPWAVHPQRERPSVRAFLRSAMDVRRGRYDVALITGAPWRLAAAVRATGIPTRIAGARRRNTLFLTHVLAPDDPRRPASADHLRLLSPLGVRAIDDRYALDAARLGAVRTEVSARLPDRFIAVHPFAAVVQKRVALPQWLRLGALLNERNTRVVWFGTRAELNELRSAQRQAVDQRDLYLDDLAPDSLTVAAAVLSLACGFVGHDSGPLHVAGAFGVPVVDVFVGGNPARYGPYGRGQSRVLRVAAAESVRAEEMLGALDDLGLFSAT